MQVAAVVSYENGQSTLNILQLPMITVRQGCLMHVAAIVSNGNYQLTLKMLQLPMRTVRQ